jgi:hypothetical protein
MAKRTRFKRFVDDRPSVVTLSPAALEGLASVAREPVRRDDNPNGLSWPIATELLGAGHIAPDVEMHHGLATMSWRVWRITSEGQRHAAAPKR